jgi:putative phage-type endonuclease
MSDSEYEPGSLTEDTETVYTISTSSENGSKNGSKNNSRNRRSRLISVSNSFLDSLSEDEWISFTVEIHESIHQYMQDNILLMAHPDFHKSLIKDITHEYVELWTTAGLIQEEEDQDNNIAEIDEMIEHMVDEYFLEDCNTTIPIRSHKTSVIRKSPDFEKMEAIITRLQAIEQPAQRTPEWYTFRHSLITASNISKVFGSPAQVNSLIYEKCQPLSTEGYGSNVNTDSPMHWGQKYEPLSVMLYERDYETIVADFGCIQHPSCPCIGASPDGINVNPLSERYGRMLEIKNIVNREITGIPKEAYWIQMQIQMETCDLDECDFLETRFCEYTDEDAFYQDAEHDDRGIILYMVPRVSMGDITHLNIATTSNTPHYEYMPLDTPLDKESVDEWIQTTRQRLRRDWSLYTTLYWYLAESSCVLVERNREWFSAAKPKIEAVWQTVLKERETGHEHRASKKRASSKNTHLQKTQQMQESTIVVIKEGSAPTQNTYQPSTGSICLVKLDPEDI